MKSLNLIMLVDDNDADNEYHEMVIKNCAITKRLISVTNAQDALAYLGSCFSDEGMALPDMMFVDINMPRVNGFEMLDKLRALPDPYNRRGSMKILMLTGSFNPDDYNRANKQYMDLITGFRVKPLTDTMFLKIIQTYF